jgi:hypothetical protein
MLALVQGLEQLGSDRQGAAAQAHRLAKAPPSAVEWKLDAQGCARPRGAVDGYGTAERLDAVFQPDEPGAPDRICSANPVVTDAEPEYTVTAAHLARSRRESRRARRVGRTAPPVRAAGTRR